MTHQLNQNDVQTDLVALGLAEDLAGGLATEILNRRQDVGGAMMLNMMRVNPLVDMQWRFGITSSNQDVRHLGNTFLQMVITLDMGNKVVPYRLGRLQGNRTRSLPRNVGHSVLRILG